MAALAAAQDAGSISEAERLSRHLTMGANEAAAPASLLQVGGAGRVVGKKSLKLWERLGEPKIATLVNVHEHGRTLALVAVGYNRIGKQYSSAVGTLNGLRWGMGTGFLGGTYRAGRTGCCCQSCDRYNSHRLRHRGENQVSSMTSAFLPAAGAKMAGSTAAPQFTA
jgi:hypothetical protein